MLILGLILGVCLFTSAKFPRFRMWKLKCTSCVANVSKPRALFFALILTAASTWLTWSGVAADVDRSDKSEVTAVDGSEFHFARLQYSGGIADSVKNWYTDYPEMDDHLSRLARRLTGINVGAPTVVEPMNPNIFAFPMIYSVEPEQMDLSPEDAANLREYLAHGGFWFADDFHGDKELDKFLHQVQRVLPEATAVELDTSHPLFHSFYDIENIVQVTNDGIATCGDCDQWENGPSGKIPKVFAIVDGHDRICILMAWNTDLGDGLEWADDPDYPAKYSAYAFKFLTNVIMYAMTH